MCVTLASAVRGRPSATGLLYSKMIILVVSLKVFGLEDILFV